MSETKQARATLAPYCQGTGLDIGFGGSAITPTTITFDMDRGYCPSLEGHTQILRGHCMSMPFLCNNAVDYIYSSHLLEDFTYRELLGVIWEWHRILKPGGLLVTNCPDQQKYLAYCQGNGSAPNAAHKEQDFSLETFKKHVIEKTGPWEEAFVEPDAKPYSWYLVLRKK